LPDPRLDYDGSVRANTSRSARRAVHHLRERHGPAEQALEDVTPRPRMPQGTISSKAERSVATLKAKPCDVTQRAIRTPIAPILSEPTQPAGQALDTSGLDAVLAQVRIMTSSRSRT